MNSFKLDQDLLEQQYHEFTKGGRLLRTIFSISSRHPLASAIFILGFGLFTSGLYQFLEYWYVEPHPKSAQLQHLGILCLVFVIVMAGIYVYIRLLHRDILGKQTLKEKKVLVSLMSDARSDFKTTPAYAVYEALLYNPSGHAQINLLEKVIVVVSESPKCILMGEKFCKYIEDSGRRAEMFRITIEEKSIVSIQTQLKDLFTNVLTTFKPSEVVSDYTGGTKDMSIALLKTSESELILALYLASAAHHT